MKAAMNPDPPTHPLDLPALLDAGDHACIDGDPKKLVDIAHLVASSMGPPLDAELLAIERLAGADFPEACRRWSTVARSVRDWVAASYVHR